MHIWTSNTIFSRPCAADWPHLLDILFPCSSTRSSVNLSGRAQAFLLSSMMCVRVCERLRPISIPTSVQETTPCLCLTRPLCCSFRSTAGRPVYFCSAYLSCCPAPFQVKPALVPAGSDMLCACVSACAANHPGRERAPRQQAAGITACWLGAFDPCWPHAARRGGDGGLALPGALRDRHARTAAGVCVRSRPAPAR